MGETALHPDLQPLEWLVGAWTGGGRGLWAGGGRFEFSDEIAFEHDGRRFLEYRQRTGGPDGSPSHGELGYLTPDGAGGFNWTIAGPIGITEVLVGHLDACAVDFESVAIGRTAAADKVTSVRRRLSALDGGGLRVEVAIGVNSEPTAPHTESVLRRA
jgi:hypothetical protein